MNSPVEAQQPRDGGHYGPGTFTPEELAKLSGAELTASVQLIVHEWMIGNILPVDSADTEGIDKTLRNVTSSTQKLTLVHAIELRTGLKTDLSASSVLCVQWLADSVSRALQSATQEKAHA